MRLPRNVSPAAARRRTLLADLAVALAIAVAGLVTLLVVLPWMAAEGLVRRLRRRRAGRRSRRSPRFGRRR